jgi:hypothetical protein
LILLGPQPGYRTLRLALQRLKPAGPVAVVTAGWEEEELDERNLAPLMEALPPDSINLQLFQRSEELFAADPEVIAMMRERQDELRLLRDVYRIRLEHALDAYRQIGNFSDERVGLEAERQSAMEMVRLLDRQYFLRTSQIIDKWEDRLNTGSRPEVVRHRREIGRILADVCAVVVSGGHAGIILNRLKLFGIDEMAGHLPLVAWSAGAMALAGQIVFFHDRPPQGKGDAELLRAGIGLFHEFLPLPDARRRLRLDDADRVAMFARRFEGFQCVVMDDHTIMDRNRGRWHVSAGTMRLDERGRLSRVTV